MPSPLPIHITDDGRVHVREMHTGFAMVTILLAALMYVVAVQWSDVAQAGMASVVDAVNARRKRPLSRAAASTLSAATVTVVIVLCMYGLYYGFKLAHTHSTRSLRASGGSL